eukprot:6988959-Pyramimonas_sp.AAC.1
MNSAARETHQAHPASVRPSPAGPRAQPRPPPSFDWRFARRSSQRPVAPEAIRVQRSLPRCPLSGVLDT